MAMPLVCSVNRQRALHGNEDSVAVLSILTPRGLADSIFHVLAFLIRCPNVPKKLAHPWP